MIASLTCPRLWSTPARLLNLGSAFEALDRPAEAMACYEKARPRAAAAVRPKLTGPHNNLGNALRKHGRINEAMAHYQRALDIKPDYAEAHRHLANTLLAFDRNQEAIAHYEQSLATKPARLRPTTRRRPSHPRSVRGRSPQQARPTRPVLAPVRPRAGQTGVGVIGQKGPPEGQRARTTKQYHCFHRTPCPPRAPLGIFCPPRAPSNPDRRATELTHRTDYRPMRDDFRPFWISGSDAFRPPHS